MPPLTFGEVTPHLVMKFCRDAGGFLGVPQVVSTSVVTVPEVLSESRGI